MNRGRREFLGTMGKAVPLVFLSSPFLQRCQNKITGPEESDGEKPKINPFENYKPDVNQPPYFDREYGVKEVLSSKGYFDFIFEKKRYVIRVENLWGDGVSGIEGILYKDKVNEEEFISVSDPNREYLSNIFIPKTDVTKNVLKLVPKKPIFMGDIKDFVVYILDIDLPSWQIEKADDMPGYFYLGDWSFEDLKDVNTILEYGSLAISVLFPNPITPVTYSVLSTTGSIIDNVDNLIDALNFVSENMGVGFRFDKEQAYSFYVSPSEKQHLFLFPSYYRNARSSEEINNLFPLQIGNSLEFTDGFNRYLMTVKGTKNVKGKDLISIIHSGGVEEYYGFDGETLKYYGLNDPSVGNLFFDPAVKVGDSSVSKGKEYKSNSKIISEKRPEISGTVNENFSCEYRENLIVPAGPFGDCFKFKEKSEIELKDSNTGKSASNSFIIHHWYAKNIGKVKQQMEDFTYELLNARVNGLSKLRLKPTGKSLENVFLNPVGQKVIETIKRLK